MKIGTVTTGAAVVTTINLNYLPAWLYYVAATQFTSIKVTVEGDGTILDLDQTGLTTMSSQRRYGAVANSYMLPLADGFIPNKVVQIVITNSAAQTPAIYGFSQQKGTTYVQSFQQLVLANSQIDVNKFAYLGIDTPTTADIYTVTYAEKDEDGNVLGDGLVQRYESTEFLGVLSKETNVVSQYAIDNMLQGIRRVNINPSTNRNIYIQRYQPIGNVS